MRRRRFLGLSTLAVIGLSGCSSAGESSESTSPPDTTMRRSDDTEGTTSDDGTDAPTDSTTASTSSRLSVELDSLQPAIVVQRTADSIGVESETNSQYLYLDVAVESDTAPAREDLRVRFDGREFGPVGPDRRLWRAYNHGNSRYDAESGGWLSFELPETGDASDVALVAADGQDAWPIVSRASTNFDGRLESKSPSLSLEWSVPDTVEPGATPTLSFTVTNEGDHDGTFVGALNRSGPSVAMAPIAAVREVIPPGEPTTFEVTDDLDIRSPGDENTGDGEADVRYDLHWTGRSRSQQIGIVESSE